MPLNTPALAAALESAFLANLTSPTPEQLTQVHTMSEAMASAMQAFVQSATITYTVGLVDSSGPVSGVFGNTIT